MSSEPVPLVYALEVVILPVTDVDRSVAFYVDGLGFALDVDYAPTPDFRVVQVTPPGSAASVQLGVGLTTAEPGSVRGGHLVVADIVGTHRQLTARGVPVAPLGWRGVTTPAVQDLYR